MKRKNCLIIMTFLLIIATFLGVSCSKRVVLECDVGKQSIDVDFVDIYDELDGSFSFEFYYTITENIVFDGVSKSQFLLIDQDSLANDGLLEQAGTYKYCMNLYSNNSKGDKIVLKGRSDLGLKHKLFTEGHHNADISYIYVCYEIKSAPQGLLFEHYFVGNKEDDEHAYGRYYQKITLIFDENKNLLGQFIYRVEDYVLNPPDDVFIEETIKEHSSIVKGKVKPLLEYQNNTYYQTENKDDFSKTIANSFTALDDVTQNITNEEVYYPVINNFKVDYRQKEKFGKFEFVDFLDYNGYKTQYLLVYDSALWYNASGDYEKAMTFTYRGYEQLAEPTALRFEYYFTNAVKYWNVVLVFDENNNLILELFYTYYDYDYLLYKDTCTQEVIEDFITKNLIFVKGE